MSSIKDDLAEIETLHARDVQAVLAKDKDALATLWSEDGVMLAPGGPPLRGDALFAALQAETDHTRYEVVDYQFAFEEVAVIGDYAFEWGSVSGCAKDPDTGELTHSAYNLLRVLIREAGEWKVHRAIWNSAD